MIQGGDPLGHRHRRPRLPVRATSSTPSSLRQALPAGDGQRGPGHQRVAVLHHGRPDRRLNRKHTIFGEVADDASQKVVDAIIGDPDQPPHRPTAEGRGDHDDHRGEAPFLIPYIPYMPVLFVRRVVSRTLRARVPVDRESHAPRGTGPERRGSVSHRAPRRRTPRHTAAGRASALRRVVRGGRRWRTSAVEDRARTACYRHPDRETGIRCTRCERPICPECMVSASVGFQCPECVRQADRGPTAGRAHGGGRPGSPRRPAPGHQGAHRAERAPSSWSSAIGDRWWSTWSVRAGAAPHVLDQAARGPQASPTASGTALLTSMFLHAGGPDAHRASTCCRCGGSAAPLEQRAGPGPLPRAVLGRRASRAAPT